MERFDVSEKCAEDDGFRRDLFVCDCSDISHQFVMGYWPDDSCPTVFCEILLNPKLSFLERLTVALRYLFKPKVCIYGAFEEVVLKRRDAPRLQRIVDYLYKEDDTEAVPLRKVTDYS